MNIKLIFLPTLVFLNVACVTSKIKHHPEEFSKTLFPTGIYHQDVKLTILKTEHLSEQKYHFQGVVRLSSKEIQVVVLSPFGTTEFKILENLLTHEIKAEIYRDSLKKFEPKLKDYYGMLRLILLAKSHAEEDEFLTWTKISREGLPLELESKNREAPVHFSVQNYDANLIPSQIEIRHTQFQVVVTVESYDI